MMLVYRQCGDSVRERDGTRRSLLMRPSQPFPLAVRRDDQHPKDRAGKRRFAGGRGGTRGPAAWTLWGQTSPRFKRPSLFQLFVLWMRKWRLVSFSFLKKFLLYFFITILFPICPSPQGLFLVQKTCLHSVCIVVLLCTVCIFLSFESCAFLLLLTVSMISVWLMMHLCRCCRHRSFSRSCCPSCLCFCVFTGGFSDVIQKCFQYDKRLYFLLLLYYIVIFNK